MAEFEPFMAPAPDKKLRILFVHPGASISISDVGRGYRAALERAGHQVADYHLLAHREYHRRALPDEVKDDQFILARQSSENVLTEALKHRADLVVVISGLNLHPIALWLMSAVGMPHCVVFTESPYDDEGQAEWLNLMKEGVPNSTLVFTNDAYSSQTHPGWMHLAPAFDPNIHHPAPVDPEEVCDVLLVGTGWRERQAFLEAVDWTGIDLRLWGVWPHLQADSPLARFHRPLVVDNARISKLYCSAKVNINFHRRHPDAITPNPRIFEVAACGAFQLSDPRQGLTDMFGTAIPTYTTPGELEAQIRMYLKDDYSRKQKAMDAQLAVRNESFDARVAELVNLCKPATGKRRLEVATV